MKTVAEFEIRYHQFLDAEGRATGPLPDFAKESPGTSPSCLKMYRLMTLVRTFDTKADQPPAHRQARHLRLLPRPRGHACRRRRRDAAARCAAAPVYREYGSQLWRGVTMAEILMYWGGDERGNDFGDPAA